uniref:Uncharacterized protein n=1 Tax=viral metagenome TaxID=1070528 RepID=A0A6C0IMG8_9ZZZZ
MKIMVRKLLLICQRLQKCPKMSKFGGHFWTFFYFFYRHILFFVFCILEHYGLNSIFSLFYFIFPKSILGFHFWTFLKMSKNENF